MQESHNFVHLHAHSAYSLLEGAVPVGRLVELCQKYRMPALGLTDSSNLFGALEFALAAKSKGIQPIIGCQLHVQFECDQNRFHNVETFPLVLLVKNETGYINLSRLVSAGYCEVREIDRPYVTFEELLLCSEGLILLTGGHEGYMGQLILRNKVQDAHNILKKLQEAFQDNLYIEIMRHGLAEQAVCEDIFMELAHTYNIPIVASNDVYFAYEKNYEAHDALICIAEGRYVSETNRRKLTAEHYMKSPEQMMALFSDLPEAINNTLVVAQKCAFMPQSRDPILPKCPQAEGKDESDVLTEMAKSGLQKRLENDVYPLHTKKDKTEDISSPYWARLQFELDVIIQMGFQGYFLIVADFIQWAKEQEIPVGPGRGSGAGSVVAWALSITDLDPLRWGLLFERFLNPERISMPDFDIDFCQDRRDEVIGYVQNRYGKDRVAQIITFGSLQARAVLRDVGRVLQMPYGQVDRICKLVPNNPAQPVTLQEAIDTEPLLRSMQDDDETVKKLIEISLQLEGLYRHASTHAAGVVIADRDITKLVPLYSDQKSDIPATQFNMKFVEKAGLVKFDFLGLKTLTVLSKTLALLKAQDIHIELAKIPLDHQSTYEMIARGETMGVFQFESAGMRDLLMKSKADCFEDLIAAIALYRPGPMDNIPKYLACKLGQEKPDYLDKSVKDILEETYGVMIYQEQVMQIAQTLGGFSLGGADLLRRAMGKKIKSEMAAQRKIFVEGAIKNGLTEAKATNIFDQVNKFAGYGFNKSHAAAYALISYQTAYMKANYPVAFFAASMELDIQNTDKLNIFVDELKRLKIPLFAPDINISNAFFTIEMQGDKIGIRYALPAIKGVGSQSMAGVVKEREISGKFASIADFLSRIDARSVNKRQLEALICAGAFDTLYTNRHALYNAVEHMVLYAQAATQNAKQKQSGLFDQVHEINNMDETDLLIQFIQDWPSSEKLQKEFEYIGFFLRGHPLDTYHSEFQKLGIFTPRNRTDLFAKDYVKLAGIMISLKEKKSSKGNKFAFLRLSTPDANYEITLFSEILSGAREIISSGQPLIIEAEVVPGENDVRLIAQSIYTLEKALSSVSDELHITISSTEDIMIVEPVLQRASDGKMKVIFDLDVAGDHEVSCEVEIEYPKQIFLLKSDRDDLFKMLER